MDKKYWKSLEELKYPNKAQIQKEVEFQESVKEEFQLGNLAGISRRKFLALSAATLAITTTACKNYRDKGEIVPYNQKPLDSLPGKASYYASTCTACSHHCGILIKTVDGRPIKVDGNPDNPRNKGKICATGQANILNLYNPERFKKPLVKKNGKWQESSFEQAFSELSSAVASATNQNKEIAIITKPIYSPTFAKILSDLQKKYPTTKIYSYEFLAPAAQDKAWNDFYPLSPSMAFDFSKAKVIVAFESNFLANEGNFVTNIREFTSRRNVKEPENFNRLYAIESDLTLTGANSDYRIPLHTSQFSSLLGGIINEIITVHSSKLKAQNLPFNKLREKFSAYELSSIASQNNLDPKLLKLLVKDLVENQGASAIVIGESQNYQIHLLGLLLNEILSNTQIMRYNPKPLFKNATLSELSQLSQTMNSGKVGLLINLDCNPVFHLPSELNFAKSSANVPYVFTLTEFENETATNSTHIIPISHNFESWGDFFDGWNTYSIVQPVIEPIFGTYQKESIILGILENKITNDNHHKYLKSYWETEIYPRANTGTSFEQFWFSLLHDGAHEFEPIQPSKPLANFTAIDSLNLVSNDKTWTLIIKKSYFIDDGKYLNNGWLLELPHPITKITWDNYLAISEKDAKSMNLSSGDVVEIKSNGKSFEAPVFIVPGIAEKTLVIEAGFGRTNAGIVGKDVGFNPLPILGSNIESNGYVINIITITKSNRTYPLASTVEHHSLNDTFVKDLHKARHIIQEGKVEEYISGKIEIHRAKELISIIPEIKYTGVKWAMAIDLNKCVGCGACITACNVENNVPVVGKDQVIRGREMQWIRIDTYFSGTAENPEVSLQPMLCQHCDDAPCENVCPVVATNHSPDGLNQMVYNRCVGTRYCSNNCPYKVRRFNFYDFRDHFANGFFYEDSLRLMNNPEVTVRSRGVMEKCTFCIQRITEARQSALAEGRELKGSDVKTACQEACPAEAIIFGDMHDKDSEVSFWRNHKLGYYVLEELNIKPNVTYVAKLRNKIEEDKA
jgi:molybdopterin-containing oxidoreductase family iron-sulfur binding subunit